MPTPSMKAILDQVLLPTRPSPPERARRTGPEPAPDASTGSNGGPPLEETALAEITRIGRAMYGERWISAIAKDAGEHVRQVQRWRAGTSQPSQGALEAVRRAARRHIARIQRALGE
jgi:hypothetical protein